MKKSLCTSDITPSRLKPNLCGSSKLLQSMNDLRGLLGIYTRHDLIKLHAIPEQRNSKAVSRGNLAWKVETRQSCQKRPDESSTIVVIQRPSTPNPSKRSLPRYHTFFRKGWGGKGHFRTDIKLFTYSPPPLHIKTHLEFDFF